MGCKVAITREHYLDITTGSRAIGVSFREACDRGYLRPYDPQRVPDSCRAALVQAAAKEAQEKGMTPRDGP